ncbi:MAG TPA: phosphoribosylamine--glycine ligase [Myxococcota bacterium]|nr:phosphoribosylamine--glycine ligase [Myxococcota bacterium]
MTDRILIVGHGAREHVLAHKLSMNQTASSREVLVLFGNAGIARDFECLTPKDESLLGIVETVTKIAPDLIVIGPENYLAEGLVNALKGRGLNTFGPTKDAALLESSKVFTKALCRRAGIDTANARDFSDVAAALSYVNGHPLETLVLKADGLCAGKGVVVCQSKQEARDQLRDWYLAGGLERLGLKHHDIIIEDFLDGSEVSVFGAVSGSEVALFCPMQDYKRLLDFDQGPNTGGMGAVGPLGNSLDDRRYFLEIIKESVFLKALHALKSMDIRFSGLLYAGLMLTKEGPKLLEFNVRFGDPETQALLHGTKADIYPLLSGIARDEQLDTEFWQKELLQMDETVTIVLASEGYPFSRSESQVMTLPKCLPNTAKLYFASTAKNGSDEIRAGSGRVVSVTASASTIEDARSLGYGLLSEIEFAGMRYRKDIGTNMTKLF